jgi:hypothetical protein
VGCRLVEGPGLGPRALVGRDGPTQDLHQRVSFLDDPELAMTFEMLLRRVNRNYQS